MRCCFYFDSTHFYFPFQNLQVKSALEELFSVRCHPLLSSGRNLFDFESDTDGIRGRTSDVEPFCGRYSIKNPGWIFHKGTDEEKAKGVPVSTSNNKLVRLFFSIRTPFNTGENKTQILRKT